MNDFDTRLSYWLLARFSRPVAALLFTIADWSLSAITLVFIVIVIAVWFFVIPINLSALLHISPALTFPGWFVLTGFGNAFLNDVQRRIKVMPRREKKNNSDAHV